MRLLRPSGPLDLLPDDTADGTIRSALPAPLAPVSVKPNPAADRVLVARIEYTCAQRGTGALHHRADAARSLSWFRYGLGGIPTALHAGILLGPADDLDRSCLGPGVLTGIADDIGASLLKLTRLTATPSPIGEVHTQRTPRWTIVHRTNRARELLPLGSTYDQTVAGFGRHTRRNLRLARKFATAERFTFSASTTGSGVSVPGRVNLAREARPTITRAALIRRLEAHADRSLRPFRTTIRAPEGNLVSYACGYFGEPNVAYLLYQLNDPGLNAIGPSLLHRAYLIEWLITQGCQELVFVHGCSGILHHACTRFPLEELFLLRHTPAAYAVAALIAANSDASFSHLARPALAARFSRRSRRP